jgi:hypothetical protein
MSKDFYTKVKLSMAKNSSVDFKMRDFLTALMDMTWERRAEKGEDEKENKRVMSLRRCHSALRIHLKRFSDSFLLLIKMTNIKFSFNSLLI